MAPWPLPGSFYQQRYLSLARLGKGTFTTLYTCLDLRTGGYVAVKSENLVEARSTQGVVLEKEAAVLRGLSGTGVAPELIQADLHALRSRTAKFSSGADGRRFLPVAAADACYCTLQILRCVEAMHGRGLIHRDVKPSNVVRTGRGEGDREFKIIDFGLSKFFVGEAGDEVDAGRPFESTGGGAEVFLRREKKGNVGFRGTTMYASVRAHEEKDACRADDVASALYTFVDLVVGDLPWRAFSTGEGKDKATVLQLKQECAGSASHFLLNTPLHSNVGFSDALQAMFDYVGGLGYYDDVDYDKVRAGLGRCKAALEGEPYEGAVKLRWGNLE
ncbi:hypothetical protein TeGR_g14916, partial [Tetraparma gracilis]